MKRNIFAFAVALTLATNLSAQTQINRLTYATDWGKGETNSAFAGFDSWANQFTNSNTTIRAQIVSDGVALAKKRRAAFVELIKTDPEKVLALTVPASIRQRLPADVVNELETRVSGIGDYSVIAALPVTGGPSVEPIQRFVHLNGQTYRAYVYGRRLGETCKNGIPLHGVILDGVMAVHESALRELEPDETPEATKQVIDLRTTTQQSLGASTSTLTEMGGTIYRFVSPEQMQQAEARLEAAEAGIGPKPLEAATNIINDIEQSGSEVRPLNSPTPWTTGPKNVLIIRIDFSDLPGDPKNGNGTIYTSSYVQNLADSEFSPYYSQSSYGLTSLSNTVTTQLYRMPQTAAFYATNGANGQLHADAESAASQNYTLSNYDRIILLFSSLGSIPGSRIYYGGQANIGGPDVWVNGEFNFRVVAHELGHTYGLFHANLWQVGDGKPISVSGTNVEYGDDFDTMGADYPNDLRTDFNPWFKNTLGWISDSQVQTVIIGGTYRIYAFDFNNYIAAPGETLALKLIKDDTRNYWIGYRCNFTNNSSIYNGAYIIWGYNYNRQSDLLDMTTPGNSDQDAALAVGATFNDKASGITIKPVAKGGVAPNKYLDIQITLPSKIIAQPGNQTVLPGQNATFSIGAFGYPAPTFQWQRMANGTIAWTNLVDNGDYNGSKTTNLVVNATTVAMNGDFFQCIVSNTFGSITSSPAMLTTVPYATVTLAGFAGAGGSSDGTGSNARFNNPTGVAADTNGNVYVADNFNNTIRKITPAGVVSTLAGVAGWSGSADGTGSNARFNCPNGLAVDGADNVYVVDTANDTIRKITPAGVVTTLAGLAGSAGSVDGTNGAAQFYYPYGITADNAGNIFVADSMNYTIRKVTPIGTNWVVSTLAGAAGLSGSADGIGNSARFFYPYGITVDNAGNVFVADSYNQTIRKITSTAVVTTILGTADSSGSIDDIGSNAQFYYPFDLTVDNAGNIYVADSENETIRKAGPVSSPLIQIQPQSQTNITGQAASFTVQANGFPTLNYQWQKNNVSLTNGGRISGATNATLTIADLQTNDTGNYVVVLTNVLGTTNSRAAVLAVEVAAAITMLPQSSTNNAGSSVIFTVSAIGDAPLIYQWRKDGINVLDGARVNGANSPALSITNLQIGDAGGYIILITNNFSGITSDPPAVLTVNDLLSPSLVISNYADFQAVSTNAITLAGTASDAGRGESGIASVKINGASANGGTASGASTASWRLGLSLSVGNNTFSVVAADTQNNSITNVIHIVSDTNRPTIVITSPTAGQHMTNALATFAGTASDNWKVNAVWYQLTNAILTSGAWSLARTTNSFTNWTATLTLAAGTNTIKAYAVDLGGNFSTTNALSIVSSNTFTLQLVFTNALPLKTNGVVFSLQLSKGLNGHIQVSTNLTSWVTLTNFTGTNTTLNFRDPAATNSSYRYYRAVIP